MKLAKADSDWQQAPWQHRRMRPETALFALFLLAGCGRDGPPAAAIEIYVEQLADAYAADEQAAEARFAGHAMIVTGKVETVGGPGSANPVAWLSLPDDKAAPAFLSTGPATVRADQLVRLHCERVDHLGPTPYLYACKEG